MSDGQLVGGKGRMEGWREVYSAAETSHAGLPVWLRNEGKGHRHTHTQMHTRRHTFGAEHGPTADYQHTKAPNRSSGGHTMGAGPQGVVYFCPKGWGERGRGTERGEEREKERPTELERQPKMGGRRKKGYGGVRKVTEAERSFVFVLIKTCWISTDFH